MQNSVKKNVSLTNFIFPWLFFLNLFAKVRFAAAPARWVPCSKEIPCDGSCIVWVQCMQLHACLMNPGGFQQGAEPVSTVIPQTGTLRSSMTARCLSSCLQSWEADPHQLLTGIMILPLSFQLEALEDFGSSTAGAGCTDPCGSLWIPRSPGYSVPWHLSTPLGTVAAQSALSAPWQEVGHGQGLHGGIQSKASVVKNGSLESFHPLCPGCL